MTDLICFFVLRISAARCWVVCFSFPLLFLPFCSSVPHHGLFWSGCGLQVFGGLLLHVAHPWAPRNDLAPLLPPPIHSLWHICVQSHPWQEHLLTLGNRSQHPESLYMFLLETFWSRILSRTATTVARRVMDNTKNHQQHTSENTHR